jgi:hypothetical protein
MNSPNKFGFNVENEQVPNIINVPNNAGNVRMSQEQPPFGGVQNAQTTSALASIKKALKIVKWCLIPLSLIQLLFILPHAYPLLVTIAFPLMGFIGILKLSHYLLKLFGIYLVILCLMQIILMAITRDVAYIVVQTFFIIFELVSAYYSLSAGMKLARLDEADYNSLKA